MPRQRSRSTAPEVRDRNTRDILGRPGLAGMIRAGAAGGGRARVASAVQQPFPDPELAGAAQLLVLSVSGASIEPGGASVPFDTIVAQHGFDGVVQAQDGYWVHPISGVYALTCSLAWDGYTGGGTVQLEVDGVLIPEGLIVPAGSGDQALGMVGYLAEAGSVARVWVTHAAGAAQLCDASMHLIITDPSDAERDSLLLDTFYVDSHLHSQDPAINTYAESAITLTDGTTYTVVVDGNYVRHPSSLELGSPDAIVHLSPGQSQRDAGQDAETVYADDISGGITIGHAGWDFKMNTGSGFAHVEPEGGPFSTPQAGHSYTYSLTGEGSPLQAAITDPDIATSNNGMFRVRIYGTGA